MEKQREIQGGDLRSYVSFKLTPIIPPHIFHPFFKTHGKRTYTLTFVNVGAAIKTRR